MESSSSSRQCCRFVPPFHKHRALQAWQSRGSLQPACSPKTGTAFTEQSITAGESVPTQGQSRRVVTLPILQVGHHEIENLNDIPKTTLGDKELNGYLKSLVITQNRCLTCVPFLVHKWLHSARRLLTATEQTLLGVCTHLLQQGHAEQTQGLQNSKF